MILRPETQALLDASLKCVAFFYGTTRYAGQAGVGVMRVVIDDQLLNAVARELVTALEPFGRELVDAALKASATVVRKLKESEVIK